MVGSHTAVPRRGARRRGDRGGGSAARPAAGEQRDRSRPIARLGRLPWRRLPLLLGVGLLLLPFLWLGADASLGGDDTRLYFVQPLAWLRRVVLPAYGALGGFGNYHPQQYYLAFTALLALIGRVLPALNLEALAFGIALSSGFLGVYATTLLLLPGRIGGQERAIAAIAGLLYTSAPLVATMVWATPLAWPVGIGGAPVLAAIGIAHLKAPHPGRLAAFAVASSLSAEGLATPPLALPYALGAALVTALVLLVGRRPWRLLGRLAALALAGLAANAFWILPLLLSIRIPGSVGNAALGAGAGAGDTIRSVSRGQSILDTLLLLPSVEFERLFSWSTYRLWPWADRFILLSLLLPAAIVGGLLLRPSAPRRQFAIFLGLVLAALALAYGQTVNVTAVGVRFFTALATGVPGFAMFRNFYGKFMAAYVLYDALAVALAASFLLARLRPRWRWPALAALALPVLLQGLPMLAGLPLFLPITNQEAPGPDYTQVGQFSASYRETMRFLANSGATGRVLELPLSAHYYAVFPLTRPGSVYVGSSPSVVLSGLDSFPALDAFALGAFPEIQDRMRAAVQARDYATVAAILRLTDVQYILYTSGMPGPMLQRWMLSPEFPDDDVGLRALVNALGATRVASFPDAGGLTREVYAIPAGRTLPRLYVATRAAVLQPGDDVIDRFRPDRPGTPLGDGAAPAISALSASLAAERQVIALPAASAVLGSRHDAPWRYDLDVATGGAALVVLMEPFDSGWTARAVEQAPGAATEELTKVRVNGYASGFLLPRPGHYAVTVSYGPQRFTWVALAISGLSLAALLAAALLAALAGRRPAGRGSGGPETAGEGEAVAAERERAPVG